jgi:hypothetical protein
MSPPAVAEGAKGVELTVPKLDIAVPEGIAAGL